MYHFLCLINRTSCQLLKLNLKVLNISLISSFLLFFLFCLSHSQPLFLWFSLLSRFENHPHSYREESARVWLVGCGPPPKLPGRPSHGFGLVLALWWDFLTYCIFIPLLKINVFVNQISNIRNEVNGSCCFFFFWSYVCGVGSENAE